MHHCRFFNTFTSQRLKPTVSRNGVVVEYGVLVALFWLMRGVGTLYAYNSREKIKGRYYPMSKMKLLQKAFRTSTMMAVLVAALSSSTAFAAGASDFVVKNGITRYAGVDPVESGSAFTKR